MTSLLKILFEQIIGLKSVEEYETDFGTSYSSKYVKGPHRFFNIVAPVNHKVGEMEYGDVDDNTVEIISIHIDKIHRGKNFGPQAINELVKLTRKKIVIVRAAPSSRKFWQKMGFTPMTKVTDYYTKTF
jgi:RimJ/RimL family protein N-acetyltransferase